MRYIKKYNLKFIDNIGNMPIFQIPNEDGYIEHIVCEGSRRHVLWWDSKGVHCSEPNCEINKRIEVDRD